MSQQNIDFGSFPDDPSADAIRTAFSKVQNNFDELFDAGANAAVTSVNQTAGAGITVSSPTGNVVVSANIACVQVRTSTLSVGIGSNGNLSANYTSSGQLLYVDLPTNIQTTGNIQANGFIASNSNISASGNIAGGNLSTGGSLSVTGSANIGGNSDVSGNLVVGGSIVGNVTGSASTAGTVTTNAQPNITSVGTLTGLSISGNIIPTANVTYDLGNTTNAFRDLYLSGTTIYIGNSTITANASGVTISTPGGSTVPLKAGGANTQVQYNDDGAFGGHPGMTFNEGTSTLTANNFIATSTANLGNVGNVRITGGTANYVLATNGSGNLSWVAQANGITGVSVQEEGTNVVATANTINFVGNGVTASNVGGVATVTISGSGTPGGANTQLQYNDDGIFGGHPGLTFDEGNSRFTANNLVATSTANLGNVGNITITGGTANYVLVTNGSGNLSWANVAGGGAGNIAGGANTQVQYNDDGILGGHPGMTFDEGTTVLTANNFIATSSAKLGNVGNVTITGVTANYVLVTDGSGNLSWANVAGGGAGNIAGGANTQVQYNDDGILGGHPGMTYDEGISTLTANNFVATSTANLGNVGNVTITGGNANFVLTTDGAGNLTWAESSTGNANVAGSNTQVQFNDDGVMGADANLTFDKTNGNLTVGSNVVAVNFIGSGANTPTILSGTNLDLIANSAVRVPSNISLYGPNVSLGDVANLHITGGSNGQALITDGNGVLSWANAGTGGGTNLIVQDEGTNLTTTANTLNFTGNGVVATNVGNVVTITIDGNGTPAGSNTQVQFNDDGVFGAEANFTYDKSTDGLFVGGNINAYKELQAGVTISNASNGIDSWGRMRMFSATGNTAYGFDFSFNDNTYGQGPHLAITNEHQTWNQAIILGDTLIGDPGVLFGVSAATIGNSVATTGQEAGWTPGFYVTGQSTYLPLVASGNTGNILYIDPSDDGKVSYGPAPSIAVQEEGTNVVASTTTINFVGSGVTASNVGGVATITISGGISGVSVQEEGTNVVAAANTINFVGNGVTASNVGGVATITIDGGGIPAGNIYEVQYNSGAGTFAANNNFYYTQANGLYLRSNLNLVTNGEHYTKWSANANDEPAWQLGVYTPLGSEAWELYGPNHEAVLTAFPTGNILFWGSYGGSGYANGNANAGLTIGTDIRFINLGNNAPSAGHAGIYFADGTYQYTAATGSAIIIQEEGTNVVDSANTINFVGNGVIASNVGGVATITIDGGDTPGGLDTQLQYNSNGVFGGIPNVTYSNGNLSLGNVANVKMTGGTNGYYLQTDGSGNLTWATGSNYSGNGTVAGANTQIQFNDEGNFGAVAGFTFDKTTSVFTANNIVATSTANLGNVSNVTITGGSNNFILTTDGTGNLAWANLSSNSIGNIAAGGANTQVQYNDDGVLGGNPMFTFDEGLTLLTANNFAATSTANLGDVANVYIGGGTAFDVLATVDGNGTLAWATLSFMEAAGSNTQVQYNDDGVLGGNPGFTFDEGLTLVTANNLTVSSITNLGNVGNVHIDGGSNNYILTTDGSGNLNWSNLASNTFAIAAAGANTQIQYNDDGILGGNPAFTFDEGLTLITANNLTVSSITNLGNVSNVHIDGGANSQVLTTDGSGNLSWANGGISGITVQEEGTNVVASTTTINFVGNSVTASNVAGVATITISDSGVNVAGSNTQVQFNDDGVLGATAGLTFDKSTTVLTANNFIATSTANLGNVANVYIGGGNPFEVLATIDGNGTLAWATIETDNAAGSNTQVQYNDDGVLGGSPAFTFDEFLTLVTANNFAVTSTANLGAVGNVTITGGTVGQVLSTNGNGILSWSTVTSGITGIAIQEEGTNVVASANTINFIGNGVTASNVGNVATVSINGISGISILQNANLVVITDTLGFTGPLVSVANVPGNIAEATIGLTVKDEGNVVTGNAIFGGLNFIGAGVTASADGNIANITIPGASITVQDEGNNVVTNATIINFVGNGVTSNNVGGVATVTIEGSGEVANANYANFAGTAYSVSGSNVSGEVANANYATFAGTAYSVSGSNVSGEVANANYATFAGTAYSVDGANVSGEVANANYATFAGTAFSVSGSNVSGEVANANYATYAGTANTANSSGSANTVNINGMTGNTYYITGALNTFGSQTIHTTSLFSYDSNTNTLFAANANIGNVYGIIRPTSGTGTNGIIFPANPGGGTGDLATIQYYAANGETTVLELSVTNDPDDRIQLTATGGTTVTNTLTADALVTVGNATIGNHLTVTTGGATITGNLDVTGNLNVTGNLTYQSIVDLVVDDPLIYLAANNTGNLYDLGFVASFVDSYYQHTGFARDHNTGIWRLFTGLVPEPTTTIDWANSVYAPFAAGSITSDANISATGNVSANNLSASNNISATGNVSGGNLSTTGTANVGTLIVTGNANVGNLGTSGLIVATGNITGSQLISTVTTGTAPLVVTSTTRVANLNVGYANVADFINVNTVTTGTFYPILANALSGNVEESANANLTFNAATGALSATLLTGTLTTAAQPNITGVGTLTGLNVNGTVTAVNFTANTGVFTGNGSGLTNIQGGNVVGNVTSAITANFANYAGNVTVASQANITSVGTLTGLNVSGNASFTGSNVSLGAVGNLRITGGSNNYILTTDGLGNISWNTGSNIANVKAGGVDTQVQYNDSGILGGNPGMTFNEGTTTLTANNFVATSRANLGAVGNVYIGGGNSGEILTTNGSGVLSWSNTITTTGNVTVGNIIASGYHIRSVATGITALGTTQANAFALTKEFNLVTVVSSGTGVALPTAVAGMAITVINKGSNELNVYPAVNAAINSASANAAYSQPINGTIQYIALTTSQWYTVGGTYA